MGKLSDVAENKKVKITSIGLTVGGIVQMVSNQKKRPLLVYSRNTLIAVNRKESEKIVVEVI